MGAIYVVSVEEAAGKTAICAGLGMNLLGGGKKVGYLKPSASEKSGADGDVAFMKQVLGLSDIVNAPDLLKGRDVVLVESRLGYLPDRYDMSTADKLNTRLVSMLKTAAENQAIRIKDLLAESENLHLNKGKINYTATDFNF